LVGEQEDSLQTEFAVAKVEQILKRWPKEVEDHGVVVALCAEPPDKRDTNTAGEGLVDL